jgi:hypothetical protein
MSTKKQAIKTLHAHLARAGWLERKRDMVNSYGKESTTELTLAELRDLTNKVKSHLNEVDDEANKWRKRVMAAIGAWLRSTQQTESADYIKSIACRAAGADSFNRITTPALRRIYAEFGRKSKVADHVQQIKKDDIDNKAISN